MPDVVLSDLIEFEDGIMVTLVSIDDELSLDDTLTMEVIGFVPIYGSVEGADRYFSECLHGQLWETTSASNKTKALITATREIDNLRFAGSKSDDTQPLEFPRNGDTSLPENLQRATYEEALALLRGIEPDTENGNLRVNSRVFGKVRTDYDARIAPHHVVAGIASFRAWQLLLPLLDPAKGVKIRRWS